MSAVRDAIFGMINKLHKWQDDLSHGAKFRLVEHPNCERKMVYFVLNGGF
jgi:hypothetical protein